MSKDKPCPFCGSDRISGERGDDAHRFQAECADCGACGPLIFGREYGWHPDAGCAAAFEEWHNRLSAQALINKER